MEVSELGINLIKHFESLHDGDLTKIGLQPKLCPANIATVGYGHALKDSNGEWLKGKEGLAKVSLLYPEWDTITEEEAEKILKDDLKLYAKKVLDLNLKLTQYEFDALVSFVYNLGPGALRNSTLLKRIQERKGDIKEAFLMWVKSGGKTLKGLIKRREAEAELFINNKITWE